MSVEDLYGYLSPNGTETTSLLNGVLAWTCKETAAALGCINIYTTVYCICYTYICGRLIIALSIPKLHACHDIHLLLLRSHSLRSVVHPSCLTKHPLNQRLMILPQCRWCQILISHTPNLFVIIPIGTYD